MGCITAYALLGDDIKLFGFGKYADIHFNILTFCAFVLFGFELVAASIGKDDYFLSFFFHLDLIATASLLLDVTWFYDALFSASSSLTRAGRMSRVGARAGRAVRVVRLIRLVRVFKIYKYVGDQYQFESSYYYVMAKALPEKFHNTAQCHSAAVALP